MEDWKFKRPDGEFTALMTAEELLNDPERADQKAAYQAIIAAIKSAYAPHECLMRAIHAKDEKEAIGLVAAVKSAGLLEACAASAEGRTALEEAAMYNFHALAKTLLDHGAKAAKEGNQPKALFCAIEAGSADTAALLVAPSLAAGALEWKTGSLRGRTASSRR